MPDFEMQKYRLGNRSQNFNEVVKRSGETAHRVKTTQVKLTKEGSSRMEGTLDFDSLTETQQLIILYGRHPFQKQPGISVQDDVNKTPFKEAVQQGLEVIQNVNSTPDRIQKNPGSWIKIMEENNVSEFLLNGDSENMFILVRKVMVILVLSGGIGFSDLKPLKQSSLCKVGYGYQCTSKDITFTISNEKNQSGVSYGEIVDDYLKKLHENLPHLDENSSLLYHGKYTWFQNKAISIEEITETPGWIYKYLRQNAKPRSQNANPRSQNTNPRSQKTNPRGQNANPTSQKVIQDINSTSDKIQKRPGSLEQEDNGIKKQKIMGDTTQFHEFLLKGDSENMFILVRKVMVVLVMSGRIRFSDLKPLKQSSLCKIQNGYQCTSKGIVFNISNEKNESGVSCGEIVDDYLKKLKANLPHLNDNSPLFLCGKPSFFQNSPIGIGTIQGTPHWISEYLRQKANSKGQKVCVYKIQADIKAMKAKK